MPRTPWNLVPVLISTCGLDRQEARRQLEDLSRRHRRSDLSYAFAAFVLTMATAFPFISAYLHATEALGRAWDLWSGLGFIAIAGSMGILPTHLVCRRQHRRLLRSMQAPTCFRCGYLLQGLAPDQPDLLVIKCPECGNASPCSADAARLAGAAATSTPTLNA